MVLSIFKTMGDLREITRNAIDTAYKARQEWVKTNFYTPAKKQLDSSVQNFPINAKVAAKNGKSSVRLVDMEIPLGMDSGKTYMVQKEMGTVIAEAKAVEWPDYITIGSHQLICDMCISDYGCDDSGKFVVYAKW